MMRRVHLRPSFSTVCLTATSALLFGSALPAQPRMTTALAGLDTYVDSVMRAAEIPGMGVLVVKNDSVVFMKGFGVRELGNPAPVDPQTLFAIGSNSKAFTSAVVGILVDEGKMRWDGPITTYLPGFQLADPYVTRHVTIEDALSHRTGLSRNDALWTNAMYDRPELVRRLRYAPMSGEFRASYLYNNMMFLTVGMAAGAAAGTTWDGLIEQRIFAPLGMRSSSTSASALMKAGNVAAPHQRVGGVLKKVPVLNADPVGPAGSIVSNLQDMAQWIRMQLANGEYNGKRVISARSITEMRTPRTIMSASQSGDITAYGMGWVLQNYKGHRNVWHNGGVDGFLSEMHVLPDLNAGWVILTNSFSHSVMPALSNHIAGLLISMPAPERTVTMAGARPGGAGGASAGGGRRGSGGATGRGGAGGNNAMPATKPTLALSQYVGTYSDSLYGDMAVTVSGDSLLMVKYANVPVAKLTHWRYDTFQINWGTEIRPTSIATFSLNAAGVPGEMTVQGLATFRRAGGRGGR